MATEGGMTKLCSGMALEGIPTQVQNVPGLWLNFEVEGQIYKNDILHKNVDSFENIYWKVKIDVGEKS